MSAAIQVMLSQSTVRLRSGERADLTLTVQNGGMLVATCRVAVLGGEPRWFALSAETLAIWPGDQEEVRIALSPPADLPGGVYDLVVQVACGDGPAEPARVPLKLEIAGAAGLPAPLQQEEPPIGAAPPLLAEVAEPAAEALPPWVFPAEPEPAVEEAPPPPVVELPAAEGPSPWALPAEPEPAVGEAPPLPVAELPATEEPPRWAPPAEPPAAEELTTLLEPVAAPPAAEALPLWAPPGEPAAVERLPWAEPAAAPSVEPAAEEELPPWVEAAPAAEPAARGALPSGAEPAPAAAPPPVGEFPVVEVVPGEFPWSTEPVSERLVPPPAAPGFVEQPREGPAEAGPRPAEASWAIALTLDPPRGSGAGDGSFRVGLVNRGDRELTVRPEAADPDGGLYYLFEPFRVVLRAGGEQTVELRIRPKSPLRTGEEVRVYSFVVRARVEQDPAGLAQVRGEWEQRAPGLELSLQPPRGSGAGDGTFYVHVHNGGAAAVTVRLEASDPEQGCWYALDDVDLTVPAGQEVRTRLRVRPRVPLGVPGSRTYFFVVTARDIATKASRVVQGAWEQLPPGQ